MRDKFIIVKRNSPFFQRCSQILYISFQFLVSFHTRPQDISEVPFFRKNQSALGNRHIFYYFLYLTRIVIFPDKHQCHVQIPDRNIVAFYPLLFQVMHTRDKSFLHFFGETDCNKQSHCPSPLFLIIRFCKYHLSPTEHVPALSSG